MGSATCSPYWNSLTPSWAIDCTKPELDTVLASFININKPCTPRKKRRTSNEDSACMSSQTQEFYILPRLHIAFIPKAGFPVACNLYTSNIMSPWCSQNACCMNQGHNVTYFLTLQSIPKVNGMQCEQEFLCTMRTSVALWLRARITNQDCLGLNLISHTRHP